MEEKTPLRKAIEEVKTEVKTIVTEARETVEDFRKTVREILPKPLRRSIMRRLESLRKER